MTTRVICPECGSSNCYYRKTSDTWRCRRCKAEFQSGSTVVADEPRTDTPTSQNDNVTQTPVDKTGFLSKLMAFFGGGKK